MFGVKPLRALLKNPALPLFCKKLFASIGLAEVLQQTPHADKAVPPSEVTAQPLLAEVVVIEDTANVVIVGKTTSVVVFVVVKLCSFP